MWASDGTTRGHGVAASPRLCGIPGLTAVAVVLATGGIALPAFAYSIVGYTAAANNRFATGFPTAPVTNTHQSFVGLPYSWLGVGWASGDPSKGFGFITPKHFLFAQHYGGAQTITLVASDGHLITGTQSGAAGFARTVDSFAVTEALSGDLSVGELTAMLPAAAGLPRYGVLDANASSTTDSTYTGLPLLVYGRGPDSTQSPRIGNATIKGWSAATTSPSITTNVSTGTLQYGDSGSPDFIPWTNPDGVAELTIIGNNAATDFVTVNVYNFVGKVAMMKSINELTTPDGYALKIVGTPTETWVGNSSTSIGSGSAWGLVPPEQAPSDQYVLFSGTSAGSSRNVIVDAAAFLRGLYFKSTGSGTHGFTFSGAGTLTIGRGGMTNYDASPQVFTAAITLGDDQYWNVGIGGVTVAAVNTGTAGFLLEVDGSGTARFTGTLSGPGGLALTGKRLELTGSNSYSGGTWVHGGTLTATAGALASTSAITVDAGMLSAVDYSGVAPLSVAASGFATISGTGLTLGSVSNANVTAAAVSFTAATGTITLSSLTGVGSAWFARHAAIKGGVSSGSVTVVRGLAATITGGTVSAGTLTSGTVSGGLTTVSGSATIGRVAGGSTTIGGAAMIATLASGTVVFSGSGSAITTLAGGRLAMAGGSVSVASGAFGGTITGNAGKLAKTGGGVLTLDSSNSFSGPTSVQGGTLLLAHATALGASSVSVVAGGTITVAPYLLTTVGGLEPNTGGLVDVGTGGMTVPAGLTVHDLLTAIIAGRSSNSWTGTTGITSSSVAAAVALNVPRAVGWVTDGHGSVFFSYAAPGDTNLDRLIDTLDSANIVAAGKFDTATPSTWFEGDFNYDGLVDILDIASLNSSGLFNAGYYNVPPATLPEPSTWFTLAAACGAAPVFRRLALRWTWRPWRGTAGRR